jgi:hypothetical protein
LLVKQTKNNNKNKIRPPPFPSPFLQSHFFPESFYSEQCSVMQCNVDCVSLLLHYPFQGCQMVYFQTRNHNLGKFWRVLQWYILWPFGQFSKFLEYFIALLVYFVDTWHVFPIFGTLCREKSGNPDPFQSAKRRSN